MVLKRKRATSYSPTVSRICVKLPAAVTHRAYARCRSTVLKRARVHEAPRTIPFDQERAIQAAVAKLRAQIDMEKRALDAFMMSTPLVGHKNAARVHQLRKNEHMLRTRRIKSLETRLENLLKQYSEQRITPRYVAHHLAEHVTELAEHVAEHVTELAEHVTEHVAEHVGEQFTELAEHVAEHVTELAEHVAELAEQFTEHVAEHVTELAEHVEPDKDVAENVAKQLNETMEETKVYDAKQLPSVELRVELVEELAERIAKQKVESIVEQKVEQKVEPTVVKEGNQRAELELEFKIKKMETRIKEMEDALRLAGDAAEAAKLVLKLRAQLKRANVEEIEWDFMADGAYEAAMAEHAKVTAWLDSASPAADKRAYFENEKMQDTWLNRAMMTPRYAEIIQEQKDAWRLANMAENEHALNFIRENYRTALCKWSVRFREERSRMFRFVCNTDTEQLSKSHPSDFINVVPNKPDERELRALYCVVTTIKFKNDAKALNLAEEVYNILTSSSSKTARKEYGAYFKKPVAVEPVPQPPVKKTEGVKMGGLMAELGAKLSRRKSAMDEPLNAEPLDAEPLAKARKEPVRKEPPITRRASSAMFAELQSKLLLSGPFSQKKCD